MKKSKKIIILFAGLAGLAFVAFSAYSVYAAGYGLGTAGSVSGLSKNQISQTGNIPSVIGMIISILLSLVGVVFFLLILYAGFVWMTAAGSSEKVEKSKKILQNSAIGLVAVLAAYTIANFVFSSFLQPANATCATVPVGSPSLECKPGEVCDGKACVDRCKVVYTKYDAKSKCIDASTESCDGVVESGYCATDKNPNMMCCITNEAVSGRESAREEGAEDVLPATYEATECEKGLGQFCASEASCIGQNGKSMGKSDCTSGMICCKNCARAQGTCIDTTRFECDNSKNQKTGYCWGAFEAVDFKCCIGTYHSNVSDKYLR